MAKYSDSDLKTLLTQPGYWGYRKLSTDPWTKAFLANGASFSINPEITTVTSDDCGDLFDLVSNETAEITVDTFRVLDTQFLDDISGGLATTVVTAGTPVAGASQVVASGGWNYSKVILIENQMYDGSAPTITSVTGSVDGALVLNTDYFMVKLSEVGWGLYVIDSADVTTESQSITIVYGYTPAAVTKIYRGGIKTVTPMEMVFETINQDGDFVKLFFYKVNASGSFGHGFSPETAAEPVTASLTFTAKKDLNRVAGKQLMNYEFGGASVFA
jgi:hypothetical protein